jgi:zinc-ribbon domain
MFCPRCGQQAAEEVRFCSRCGLPLDAAAEVVEAGGSPDWHLARTEAGGALTARQRGTRKGLMLTVGGLLFFGVAILLTAFKEDFFVLLMPAGVLLTVGVMRMLYALLLEGHKPDKQTAGRLAAAPNSAPELGRATPRAAELPPARAVPASLYTNTADTNDMTASPLSVTESTTRLFDQDEPSGRR